MASPATIDRKWYVVDAEGKTLGRLASEVAKVLRGKNKAIFTPHIDTGDYVIVVNADKVKVTGKKLDQKIYYHHSDYIGASTIDNVEAISREMVGKECSDDNAYHNTECHDEWHKAVGLILTHVHNNSLFTNVLSILSLIFYRRCLFIRIEVFYLDSCPLHQFDTIVQTVFLCIYNTLDARLYDQFGTFYTWRGGDVKRTSLTVIAAASQFRNSISLRMENVWLGYVVILTDIFKSARCTIVAITDNHFIFYNQCTYLSAFAIAVFSPYTCHSQIAKVELGLFGKFVCHPLILYVVP